MTKPYIEFKKQRDFGLFLSDTFAFIRSEFKPLMKAIFTISGPAMVLFIISFAFYNYTVGDSLSFDFYVTNGNEFSNPLLIVAAALVYVISLLLAYIFTASTALHYIKSYIENNGEANFEDVKNNVYKTFWGYLGLGILKWITLIFAMMLCLVPVLYAMVPMFIVFCIYIFEPKQGTMNSYSYSFSLVNEDFWVTIGTMFILGILLYVLSMVFSVPAIIYTYAKMGIFSGEFDPANMGEIVDPVYIILNVLSTLFQILLNIMLVVASAMVYFHLNEKRNFTGTYERISNIGKIEQ